LHALDALREKTKWEKRKRECPIKDTVKGPRGWEEIWEQIGMQYLTLDLPFKERDNQKDEVDFSTT